MKPLLAILCPVFNEQQTIPLFFERLRPVIDELSDRYRVDLVFLDNASTDNTRQEILKIKAMYDPTYVLRMSRNVGYQRSLYAGLRAAKGDLFAFIDVDCEDPPEMILTFVREHEAGYDIVYGERVDREEIFAIKMMRKFFYRLLSAFADDEILLDMAEFSLFTAEVRDAILEENTSFPFVRSAISRVGFARKGIPFKRQRRIAGETHYNIWGMAAFALTGILAASTLLLRVPFYLLPAVLLSLLAVGIAYVKTASPGFAVAGALIFAAYVSTTLASVSLYVARTYKNGLQRPPAHLDRRHCIPQASNSAQPALRPSSAKAT